MVMDSAATAPFPRDIILALQARPLIPLSVVAVVGIHCAEWLAAPAALWGLVSACGCVVALAGPHGRRRAAGLMLAVYGLGAALHARQAAPGPSDPARLIGQRDATVVATVLSAPAPGETGQLVCDVTQVTTRDGVAHSVRGRAGVALGPLASGDRPRVGQRLIARATTLQAPPGATNWYQRGEAVRRRHTGVHCLMVAGSCTATGPASGWARVESAVARARAHIAGVLDRAMPGSDPQRQRHVELLGSMVFGDSVKRVDDETANYFRRTGTIHLLVVSGAQVTLIVVFLTTVMGAGRRLTWWALALLGLVLLAFGLIVGMDPSVVRALLMAAVALLSALRGRRSDLPSALALAALVLSLSETALVFEPGPQLTFAATIAVSAAAIPRPRGRDEQAPSPAARRMGAGTLQDAAVGTAAAWLFTTPILIHHFYSFALLGVLANVIVVPLSAVILVLGLSAVVLGSLWLPLAGFLCAGARVLLAVTLLVVRLFSSVPVACVEPIRLHPVLCWLWLLGAAAALYLWRTGKWRRLWARHGARLVCAAAVAFGLGASAHAVAVLRPTIPRIVTFDAGEGQCTLIETARRGAVLVDAGTRGPLRQWELADEVVVPYLAHRSIRRLDAVIVSHADIDHYLGLEQLCRCVAVGWVITGPPQDQPLLSEVLGGMTARGARVYRAAAGTALRIGGCDIEVLWPPAGADGPDDNARSLVLRVQFGDHTALLPGDIETDAMLRLLQSGCAGRLRADFLQVPHHGRGSSALPQFFSAVAPAVAVVSQAGEPEHRQGESICRQICRKVYSTEDCGAVVVEFHPQRLQVKTFTPGGDDGPGGPQ